MVSKGREGQYKCDSNCLNWASSGICSHSIVVAQLNNDLPAFLQWYNTSSNQPNITSLAMSGLPSGRGRKGGVVKRVRDRQEKRTPEVSVPRPVFQPVTSAVQGCGHSSVRVSTSAPCSSAVTPSSPFQSSAVPSANVFHSAVVGQINLPSQLGNATTVITSTPGTCSQSAVQSTSTNLPNTNPFYVKFIQGNIRICQGCRSTLRSQDGSIPNPPFDVIIARAERRSFRDKSGVLITPRQEQTCHYHLRLDCVRAVEPNFVPLALRVPADVLPSLSVIHREYLRLVFGLDMH